MQVSTPLAELKIEAVFPNGGPKHVTKGNGDLVFQGSLSAQKSRLAIEMRSITKCKDD